VLSGTFGTSEANDLNQDRYLGTSWKEPTGLPLTQALSEAVREGGYSEGLRMKQGTAGNCHFTAALASVLWADQAPTVLSTPQVCVRLYDSPGSAADVLVSCYLNAEHASLLPFDLAGEETHRYQLIAIAYLNLGQLGQRNFNWLDLPPDGSDPAACLRGLVSLTGSSCECFSHTAGTDYEQQLRIWLERRKTEKFVPTLLWSSGGLAPHAFSIFGYVDSSYLVVRDAKGSASDTTWQTLPPGATAVGYGNGRWPTDVSNHENSFGLFTLTVKQLSEMLEQQSEETTWHIGGISSSEGRTCQTN
jgi:hypothetical protein